MSELSNPCARINGGSSQAYIPSQSLEQFVYFSPRTMWMTEQINLGHEKCIHGYIHSGKTLNTNVLKLFNQKKNVPQNIVASIYKIC